MWSLAGDRAGFNCYNVEAAGMHPLDYDWNLSMPGYLSDHDCWAGKLENASTVIPVTDGWIDHATGMKLKPSAWASRGETPRGAMGQVDWDWDPVTGPPSASSHPNHPSARQHAVILGQQLDEAEKMGMVEYYDPTLHGSMENFVQNILPLAALEKAPGKVRMLVDPSLPGVNKCMSHLPCPLITVEEIFQHVKPTSVLGKRDLSNGFFHITLKPSARRHMGFTHPVTGHVGRWVVLPQGTKQSPAIFCEVTNAAARIFNHVIKIEQVGALIFIYVDDFIIIAESHADMLRAFEIMDAEAAELGLVFNPAKDIGRDTPLHTVEALGITMDAPNLELQLPETKRAQYLAELTSFREEFHSSPTAPRKTVEKLVGKLVFACRVCRWGYLFVQELLDQLYPGTVPAPSRIALTEGFWFDIQFWEQALSTSNLWMGMHQHLVGTKEVKVNPDFFNTEIFTDASKTFGVGGVWDGQVFSCPWEDTVTNTHIGILELTGLLWSLEHWGDDLRNKQVLAWLDNAQAVAAVNKGASRVPEMRPILLKMAMLGMEKGFTLKARHIPGILNPADAPSRGIPQQQWLFSEAEKFNDPPAQVDCCAISHEQLATSSCTVGFTDPSTLSAHISDLAGKVLWATVPIGAADMVIEAIVQAWHNDPKGTMATIVVPAWQNAGWYRKYMRRKQPLFSILHTYEKGAPIFTKAGFHSPAAAKWSVFVLRLGRHPML